MAGTREGTNDLWEAMSTQRAIRRWKDEPVPEEMLWKLVEMATRAPSGSNSQPWRFLIVQDPGKRSAIATAVRQRYDETEGMRRYFESGSQSEDRSTRLIFTGARELVVALDKAPVFIFPVLYSEGGRAGSDILSGSSIYTAAQNLLLAARGLGLGSVMTTFQRLAEKEIREILQLPENAVPVALLPIGFPDANFGPVNRKPVEEVAYWDGWGQARTR